MQSSTDNSTLLTLRVQIKRDAKVAFVDWQARLNAAIAAVPGFVSLEVLSPQTPEHNEWVIVQRFNDCKSLNSWRQSTEHARLAEELKTLLFEDDPSSMQETATASDALQGGVTEVFVTQITPEREHAYRNWIAKIHQVEAKFPGFRGMYVQSPRTDQGHNWITLLQFDTQENLDRWLASKERQEVLKESASLITSLERHRIISSYAGWFSSIAQQGALPPVWKQTMLVLLVLFPIVMFEIRFLNPLINSLNPSLATFIGNAISVSLVSWPMMPIAIWALDWWLSPKERPHINAIGIGVVALLYLIEIVVLWNLL